MEINVIAEIGWNHMGDMNLASQIGNKYLENKNAKILKKIKGDKNE